MKREIRGYYGVRFLIEGADKAHEEFSSGTSHRRDGR